MKNTFQVLGKACKALGCILFPHRTETQAGEGAGPECPADLIHLHLIGCSDLDARWYCERERMRSVGPG